MNFAVVDVSQSHHLHGQALVFVLLVSLCGSQSLQPQADCKNQVELLVDLGDDLWVTVSGYTRPTSLFLSTAVPRLQEACVT